MAQIEPFGVGAQMAIKLMNNRIGRLQVPPHFYRDTVTNANLMATELEARGGFPQQERMVREGKHQTMQQNILIRQLELEKFKIKMKYIFVKLNSLQ